MDDRQLLVLTARLAFRCALELEAVGRLRLSDVDRAELAALAGVSVEYARGCEEGMARYEEHRWERFLADHPELTNGG